jgi:DNA-binding winged helix-turn-helix (wHTH) protein/tetratricopeptide (TPR) repeat protein
MINWGSRGMTGSGTGHGGLVYRFADCELDVAARELRRDGVLVTVQPKVFELIAYLIEHRGRAVDKAEIQDAVWPCVVVTETSLTQAVRKARVALGDDANLQTIIRTVHGHGYRFVAGLDQPPVPTPEPLPEESGLPVGPAEDAEGVTPAPARTAEPELARPSRGKLLGWGLGAVAALAALLIAWWLRPAIDPSQVRLAVLPVENTTGEVEFDWVEIGLMGLASSLFDSAGNIPVVNNSDVMRLAGRGGKATQGDLPATLAQLGQAFGATHVLQTRLERSAGLLRVSYSLLGANGRSYEGTSVGGDVTGLMRGAVQAVASRLGGPRRLPLEKTLISEDPFVNEAFARGLALALEGRCEEARSMFAAAISQVPELFEPRYETATCARILGQWREAEDLLSALAAEQSPAGPSRALVRAQLGLGVVFNRTGRLDEAGAQYGHALQTAETVGDRDLIGHVLVNLAILAKGRSEFDQSIQYLERALREYTASGRDIVPGNVYSGLANASMETGALDDANRWLEQAIASFRAVGDRRNVAMMVNNLGFLRRLQGRLDEAEVLHLESAKLREELGDPVGVGRVHNMLAVVYNDRGKFTDAISSATIALQSAEEAHDSLYIATAHAQLGDANLGLGRLATARDHYVEAGRIFLEIGDRQRILEVDLKLAEVDVARGQLKSARTTVDRVAAEAREADLVPVEIQALLQAGDIAARNESSEAIRLYESARQRARDIGHSGDEIRASIALADALVGAGNLDAAAPLLEFLAGQPESAPLLKLRARYAWARGDAPTAATAMARARELSGSRWTESDERSLLEYQRT